MASPGSVTKTRDLEVFRMNTVIFLIFVGVCAFVAVWLTRRPGKRQDLAKPTSEKLTPTSHDRLSQKEEIWEARRQFAQKNLSSVKKYVPKSAVSDQPEYDGFSRRDRHHLKPARRIKKNSQKEKPAAQ
jgi:hypothetical protein